MPIRPLLEHDHAFGPDAIAKIVAAFEDALRALTLTNRKDPATVLVAKAILEAAKQGQHDPIELRNLAVKAFSK
jgi:hypothetical protein